MRDVRIADGSVPTRRQPWQSKPSAPQPSRNLMVSSAKAFVIKLSAAGLGYAMLVALSRAMTESAYGQFAFGFTLATVLAVVASQGLHTAVLRFWPQYSVQNQTGLAWGFVRWAGRATMTSGVAISAALALVGTVMHVTGRPAGAIFGAAALVVPLALAEFVANALRATGAMIRALAPRDILWRGLVCGLGVVTAGSHLGAQAALFAVAALLAVIVAAQCVLLYRGANAATTVSIDSTLPPTTTATVIESDRAAWVTASRVMWASAVVYVLARNVDVLLLGLFRNDAETGSYFAAQRSAQLLGLMLVAANMVAVPLIAKHFYGDDRAGLQRMLTLVAVCVSIPTLVVLLITAAFAGPLMALFDPTYRGDSSVLIILATAAAINAFAGPTGYVLEMVGQHRAHLRLMVHVYAVALLAQLVLVPFVGVMGAAIPALLASLAWNAKARRIAIDKVQVDPTILSVLPALFGTVRR